MDQTSINTFRLAGITMLTVAVAYGVAWPLAYITPLFVWNYLKTANDFGLTAVLAGIFAPAFGCMLGLTTGATALHFPILFLLVTALLLWFVFYLGSGTLSADFSLWTIIGLTLVPMLTLQSQGITCVVITGLLTSAVAAALFAWLGYIIFPVQSTEKSEKAAPAVEVASETARLRSATISLAIVLPVITIFYIFNMADKLLIMIFIAIIAQTINIEKGKAISFALVASNFIGGVAAVFIYNLLLIVPEYLFMLIAMGTACMLFGYLQFSSYKFAPIFGMAFTTTLLIVGGATMPFSDGAQTAFTTRLFSIFLVVAYFVLALNIVSAFSPQKTPLGINESS